MLRQTSLEVYKTIDLKGNQEIVYNIIKRLTLKYGNATDKEIQITLGWDINQITPRRKELVELGFVVEDSKRPSYLGKTNYTHIAWRALNWYSHLYTTLFLML